MRELNAVKNVLVLDDIEETRAWLAEITARAFPGAAVVFAGSVKEAKGALADGPLDLALVDLGLDDGSGIEVLEAAARLDAPPVSVVTTIFDDDRSLFSALGAGADGYILKGRPPSEIEAGLRGILEGHPPLSPSIARRLLSYFRPSEPSREALTPRETEVLTLVSKGHTVASVAGALSLSPNTVAGYVKEIYRKLHVSSRAEAAIEAQRRGLI